MQPLPVTLATTVCLLLIGLSRGQDTDAENKNVSTISSANTPGPTLNATPPPDGDVKTPTESVLQGTTMKPSDTSQAPTDPLLNQTAKEGGVTTKEVLKGSTAMAVTSPTPTNAVSTVQSAQPKTENQSSSNATERPGHTLQPDPAPTSEVHTLLSTSQITPQNLSQSPAGTADASNASPSATNPSYSSVILPVVIALIVITLSVFILVGLYRICRKTDPGSQDNGNDQPQSDRESVKLLTVKTIPQEPGEHSAPGKSKH